jgi:RNA polymerase sigma-70 factor (ECF subfamily)
MTSVGSRPSPEAGSCSDPVRSSPCDEPPEQNLADLVHRHLDFVWRLLRRLGLEPADAEDAAQHVLLVAAGKLGEIEPGKTRTFLYGVALRVAANQRRGQRRRQRASRENTQLEAARLAPNGNVPWPDQLAELGRAQAFLDELLAELPRDLARVLVLSEIEQCTTPEIAELEGVPVGTAASRLRRARAAFRELLEREGHRNPLREEQR